jgi:hypothetical protein
MQRWLLTSRRWVAASCGVAVLLVATLGVGSPASSLASQRPSPRTTTFKSFPLWRLLPTPAFAVLGEGVIHGRRWGIYVFRGAGRHGSERPCVQLITARRVPGGAAVSTAGAECGALAPPGSPTVTQANFNSVGGSIIGLVAGSNVASVTLTLSPAPSKTVRTRALNQRQAKKAHVKQFHYFALALSRTVCIERMTGSDSLGAVVFDSPARTCS